MSTLCKMRCTGISTHEANYKGKPVIAGQVELMAIATGIPKYEEFTDSTPSGELKLTINNPAALQQFTPGKY